MSGAFSKNSKYASSITGSTCAGPGKFFNEQWTLDARGALVSALPGARCATVSAADGTVALAACGSPLPSAQTWTHDATTGALRSGGGLCLTAAAPAQGGAWTARLAIDRAVPAARLPAGNATCGAAPWAIELLTPPGDGRSQTASCGSSSTP